jgi:hypothetical protein
MLCANGDRVQVNGDRLQVNGDRLHVNGDRVGSPGAEGRPPDPHSAGCSAGCYHPRCQSLHRPRNGKSYTNTSLERGISENESQQRLLPCFVPGQVHPESLSTLGWRFRRVSRGRSALDSRAAATPGVRRKASTPRRQRARGAWWSKRDSHPRTKYAPHMRPEDVRAYRERWALVAAHQREELRRTTPEEKFEQLAMLMAVARALGGASRNEDDVTEIRRRWKLLAKRLCG